MTQTASPNRQSDRRSWNLIATAVVLAYVAAAVVALLAADALRIPRWLVVHLLMLGAITNAIVTWSEHFAVTLMRAPAPERRASAARLVGLNIAIVGVLVGVTTAATQLSGAAAVLLTAVIGWHLASLVRISRRALMGRFASTVRFYFAASVSLVVGALFGTLMARGDFDAAHARLHAAHVHANVFGWVGLSVLGTLFTLWPTVLRTRMVEGVVAGARRSLLLLTIGLATSLSAFVAGVRPVAIAGLATYGAGVAVALLPFIQAWKQKSPRDAAAWLLAGGTIWLACGIATDIVVLAAANDVATYVPKLDALVPAMLVGFALQTLLGALTFLIPVIRGGGPAVMKQTIAGMSRWWPWRLLALNVGAAIVAGAELAGGKTVATTVGWLLIIASVAAFLALSATALVPARERMPAAFVLIALVAICAPLAIARAASRRAPDAVPTLGPAVVQSVDVSAANLAFRPRAIEVRAGTRLKIVLTNRDAAIHDLTFGERGGTPRLATGQQSTIDLGAVNAPLVGWCAVPGHRSAGMTFDIRLAP